MRESVRESLDEAAELLAPPPAVEHDRFRERLEMQVIAIAAAIQPEAQDHRHFHRDRKLPRSRRKGRRATEEIRLEHLIAGPCPVGEQRDQRLCVERFLDCERDARAVLARVDDRARELTIEGVQHFRERWILAHVDDDAHLDVGAELDRKRVV